MRVSEENSPDVHEKNSVGCEVSMIIGVNEPMMMQMMKHLGKDIKS